MGEKTGQEHDENLDQDPIDAEETLAEVDALISESDPDFLQNLSNLNVDSSQVRNEGLGLDVNFVEETPFLDYLKKAFDFKANPEKVFGFWVLFIISVSGLLVVWSLKKNLLHQDLFLTSFEKIGTAPQVFNPNSDVEAFYDNPRFSKNLVTVNRILANLKASENSGENPMVVFEITVEGLSADAIVELKDRQAEFKDLLARHTEEKSYDELVTPEGKRQLTDQFRELLNANLSNGQVRRVLFKTFIIKP